MSRRRNGTNRAAAALGLSMYGRMNTKNRKRPKELAAPLGADKNNLGKSIAEEKEKSNG